MVSASVYVQGRISGVSTEVLLSSSYTPPKVQKKEAVFVAQGTYGATSYVEIYPDNATGAYKFFSGYNGSILAPDGRRYRTVTSLCRAYDASLKAFSSMEATGANLTDCLKYAQKAKKGTLKPEQKVKTELKGETYNLVTKLGIPYPTFRYRREVQWDMMDSLVYPHSPYKVAFGCSKNRPRVDETTGDRLFYVTDTRTDLSKWMPAREYHSITGNLSTIEEALSKDKSGTKEQK